MSSKEQDAVASMLQLAANAQEQAHPHREPQNTIADHDGDIEMDNPSDSSLSEIDEDPHSSDDREPADDILSQEESGAESDEDDDKSGDEEGQEGEDTHSHTAEDPEEDGDDTEAETERLHESPDKIRTSRNVHHRAEDQLQIPDDNIDQTSEISALSDSVAGDMDHIDSAASSPRKRKRGEMESDDEADDDTAESLRGMSRKLQHRADEDEEEEEEGDELDADGEHPSPDDSKDREEDGSGDERASSKEATPDGEVSAKPTAKDEGEMSGVEDGEADGEAEVDVETKGGEDSGNKEGALTALRVMEKDFARLRDELFADKMQQLSGELDLLQRNPMDHTGYAAAMEAVDKRRNEQVRQAKVTLNFKIKSLQNKSVAERAMAHSQYLQEIQHIRDGCLEAAGEEWYRIQKARRQGDDEEFEKRYHFVPDRPSQVSRQMAYNQEVSIISGVQRYVGFPAAPEIEGVTKDESEADLKRMGISSRPKHHLPISAPISSFPRQVQPMADEHFLKANPWADPQNAYQAHAQMLAPPATQTITQTFTTPSTARRQESGQHGSASTIAVSSVEQTPMSGNQANGPPRYLPQADNSNETPSRIPTSKNAAVSHMSPQSSPLKVPQAIPVPAGSG